MNEISETKNLSSAGVLFSSSQELEIGAPVEYVITLQPDARGRSIRLRCVGKVVRRHGGPPKNESENSVAMAATLERYEFIRPTKK